MITKFKNALKCDYPIKHNETPYYNYIIEISSKEMCNDLNTPNALTILYASLKEANMMLRNPSTSLEDMKNMFGKLEDYLFILGIKVQYPILQEEDRATYKQYLEAKKEKDFAKSDSLRNVLIEKNIF